MQPGRAAIAGKRAQWPAFSRAARWCAFAMLTAALAPASPAALLTLDEAEARALAANPTARAARLEALAARQRTLQAYARHLGEADLVAIGNRYEGARLVRPITGPLTPAAIASVPFDQDQLHYGLTWQIPLFTGGALLAGDQAARLAESAAGAQAEHAVAEVRYNVRATYRSVLGLGHALEAAAAYQVALEADEASARLRVETESWSRADAAKVGFALASARARRASLEAQQRGALAVLSALVGEDGATQFELVDASAPAPEAAPAADLVASAQGQRRDLAAARGGAEALALRADAARAGFLPQLAFSGSYLLNNSPSVGTPISVYELAIVLRIPLLSNFGRVAAVREAEASAAAATERARAKALEVRAQAIEALGRVEAARAALEAGKAQRALGAEVARVEKLKLQAGTGKVEDYLGARAQELDGETGFWQGHYALQSAFDYLALVTGTGGSK